MPEQSSISYFTVGSWVWYMHDNKAHQGRIVLICCQIEDKVNLTYFFEHKRGYEEQRVSVGYDLVAESKEALLAKL